MSCSQRWKSRSQIDHIYIYICLFISSPKPSCYLDSKDIIGTNTEQHSVLEREREREIAPWKSKSRPSAGHTENPPLRRKQERRKTKETKERETRQYMTMNGLKGSTWKCCTLLCMVLGSDFNTWTHPESQGGRHCALPPLQRNNSCIFVTNYIRLL